MERIVLFSSLTDANTEHVSSLLFPQEMKHKSFAFMPSDGIANCKQEYIDQWQDIAAKFDASFVLIDNLSENFEDEIKKLNYSNILVISGGNTFTLLNNLRNSGLDEAVCKFTSKKDFVLGGYSAGALVLTPSIAVCNLPTFDENMSGITDFSGLGVVDFEVFPHYGPQDEKVVQDYSKTTVRKVRTITNDGVIHLS